MKREIKWDFAQSCNGVTQCPRFNRHSTTESIDTVDSVSNSSEDTFVSTDYDNFEFDDPLNGVSIDEL